MPRTTTLECPGCPPLKALTFDVLGLVKVIKARSKDGGVAKVVKRWGDPDSSKAVVAASIDDSKSNPLLAVARKNGLIEGLSPITGEVCFSVSNDSTNLAVDDSIAGLHLFKKQRLDSSSRSRNMLTCTTKGKATLSTVELHTGSMSCDSKEAWSVCSSGEIFCCKVHDDEGFSVYGGKGVELNIWDLEKPVKIWNSKSPPKNSLGIFTPTIFTSVTFLNKDDHRKVVAGTNEHQVRFYDVSAQRRPVLSVDFRETPIKAVAEDLDGHTIYFGNGAGDLASIDIRTGKVLGCFVGKCSGSIRSIARHPEHSIVASCGLDSYLRVWDIESRQLLSAVYLKQHLTNVVFDSNFSDEETVTAATDQGEEDVPCNTKQQSENEDEALPVKRKKTPKDGKQKTKKKAKKAKAEADLDDSE
ncbi:hypothetical protein RND81_13G093600 [Saponaria officinalis]|uniref:Transducin/WD40 repeat-like superfamily protein n=1 Tax=Saponaria officinalis TaxID=3572 RepID=A0AAW1GVI7_SAPOF